MGQVKPYTIVRDLSAWTAADWEGREHEFEYELTAEDPAEVEAALAEATRRNLPIQVPSLPLHPPDNTFFFPTGSAPAATSI